MKNNKSNPTDIRGKVATLNSDIWISVKQLAELRGISAQAIRKSCNEREGRYQDGQYKFRLINGNGGRQYEILLSSLLETDQAQYWLKHHKATNPALPTPKQEQENHLFDAEVYETIADQYSRKPSGIKEEARRRVYILDEYLKLLEGGFKKERALEIIKSHHQDTSKATLWRWLRRVENHPRQHWEVILAPGYQGRSRTEIHPRAWDFFYVNYGQLSEVHEVWESDGRVADVFCLWPDGTTSRPWVVVIRDIRTRMVLAIKIYKSTNAELVIDAFRCAVLLTGTIPMYFYVDNGTEYSNNPLTGGQKSPFRYTVIKDQPIGILTRLGVKAIWATPYHGAAKAQESWWNVIAENVDKLCEGAYTGSNPVKRPENCDKNHAIPIEEYTKRLSACVVAWVKGEFGKHRGQGMNGMFPFELYNHLMESHTKRPVSIEHIRAMRPLVFRRVLSKQRTFQMTIPGFGQVEYTPQDNLAVKRGYSYDILPDPSDPREPALIYDGSIFIGEAIFKAHMPFLDRTAGGEIWKARSSAIKKAGAAMKEVKERIKNAGVILDTAEEGLPDLLQSSLLNVLKLPPEKQPEPDDHIQIQEDGSIINTQTGEITKRNARPIFPETTTDKDAEEHERKLKELEEKTKNERFMRWKNGN